MKRILIAISTLIAIATPLTIHSMNANGDSVVHVNPVSSNTEYGGIDIYRPVGLGLNVGSSMTGLGLKPKVNISENRDYIILNRELAMKKIKPKQNESVRKAVEEFKD